MDTPRPGAKVWLAALLPIVPVVLALAVFPVPRGDDVLRLDGPWLFTGDDDGGRAHGTDVAAHAGDIDDGAWHPFVIPGPYAGRGVRYLHGWARKHFTLPRAPEEDAFLIVPKTGGFARVYVNGDYVGERGVPESNTLLDPERLDGFAVSAAALRAGDNVLALEIINPNPDDGIADGRFLLGPPAVVKTYLERATSMKWLLEYGALMVNIFGIALVAYLLSRGDAGENRGLYRASLLVMCVLVVYLMGKTGAFVGVLFGAQAQGKLTIYAIIGIALVTPELIESYYAGRVTGFRVFNRFLCAGWFAAAVLFGVQQAYKPLSPWLFVVILHALFFAARDLRRPRTEYGPVLAMAIAVTAVTGASDLLCDLNVVYTPRLFAYGVMNLGLMAVVLAFADFLRLGRQLREKNVALVDALARSEETARLKSEFLANTSHELRTPLNAILNVPRGLLQQIEERSVVACSRCGSLFEAEDDAPVEDDTPCPSCGEPGLVLEQRRFAPDDGDALAAHLQSIIGSGEHLLAVVNDILDFSKLSAGRMKLSPEALAAADVVARALETVGPVARAAGVEVRSDIDGDTHLDADRTRLTQVLINLAANAVKFSPRGGVVHVEARTVADAGKEARDVVFRVRDAGPGIAPEHHTAIFESFRQVEGGHTRRHGGTGLGLAIVKQIVELHGGTVAVESALGEGSTFIVRMPARPGPAAAPGRS